MEERGLSLPHDSFAGRGDTKRWGLWKGAFLRGVSFCSFQALTLQQRKPVACLISESTKASGYHL